MGVTALAGGVGAARFLRGLVQAVPAAEVTVIGNTGDDAVFHGLQVCPDLDTVTYTLAGIIDDGRGWGLEGDTLNALNHMKQLGVDAWFWLGDRDLGTHIARTMWLAEGLALSAVTDRIRRALGVGARILPMTDQRVSTRFVTVDGQVREFQDYFVRHRHAEEVQSISFEGAQQAQPGPGVLEAISDADLVILCPSNPVVSIGPILAVPGIRAALRSVRQRVVAVSPIIQGAALRGPADRLLPVVGADASASGVAGLYQDFCGTFVIDQRDPDEAPRVAALGMVPALLETVMETPSVAATLAKEILALDLPPAGAAGTGAPR